MLNFEPFKLPDPSGKMSKESYVLKNHNLEYDHIIEWCQSNGLIDIRFKEKVYLFINGLRSIPKCKNPECVNLTTFKNSTLGYKDYCSIRCISSDPEVKKKKEEKSLRKFGTKTPSQSKEIKDKIIKTNQQKWGGNSPMSSLGIRQKSKDTLLTNWGVDNPSKSEDILQRRIESFKVSKFKETFKKTSLEKWGVEHPWMNPDIHKKTIDFFYQDYRRRIEEKIDSRFTFKSFKKTPSTVLTFSCGCCGEYFDILPYQFYYRVNSGISICTKCFPISENSSISQIELTNFIKEKYQGEILLNFKDVINPFEIDVYLPDLKIGFEFNGVWWHSEKFKQENYHQKKSELSQSKGIQLITIWEDDWNIKREICHSFILNKLRQTPNKIGARKCVIREVSYNDSKNFLDSNHLQGDCKSSVRLGIHLNDDLVGLMTFSKLRLPLQKKKESREKADYWELTRFCNKLNYNIVGGASKILKYFIQNWQPKSIETYSDNLISDGGLYESLGFKYQHTSKPGYWYVVDGIRSHRFNWRKQKLVELGYDSSKTESEIMSEIGYWKIYNAGNKKWIKTNHQNLI